MRQQLRFILLAATATIVVYSCKEKTNAKHNYKQKIIGKWLWYKTITTGGSSGIKYDTFYNQGMFKEFLPNNIVITQNGDGTTSLEKFFFINNQLAQTYSNKQDTSISKIVSFTENTFCIYNVLTFTQQPKVTVEYWHYFVK